MYVPQDTIELGGKFQQRRLERLKHYDSRYGRNEERTRNALACNYFRRYTPIPEVTMMLDILYDWDGIFLGPKEDGVIDDAYNYIAIMTLISEALDTEPYGIENTKNALEFQVTKEPEMAFMVDVDEYRKLENAAASYRTN